MAEPASVSVWLEDLKNGDESAGAELWNRYVEDLIRLAKRKLRNLPNRDSDEEDLVVLAFNSFFMGVRANRFSALETRDDFWQILVVLTERIAIDQIRRHTTKKRGQGKVRGESIFEPDRKSAHREGIATFPDNQPTPEFAVHFADVVQSHLKKLKNDQLQQIVLLKLEGLTSAEIAQKLGRNQVAIRRKLQLIRRLWSI